MNIGIDIDGVLTDISKYQLVRGKEYFGTIVNRSGYEVRNIFECSFPKECLFWLHNLDYYSSVRDGASDFSHFLHNNGDNIILASARNPLLWEYTRYWLKKNDICYDKLIYSSNKLKVSSKYDIDMFIEDSPKNTKLLSKHIPVLCMNAPYNEDVSGNNIYKINDFDDAKRLILKKYINHRTPYDYYYLSDGIKDSINKEIKALKK